MEKRAEFEDVREVAAGSIGASYSAVGAAAAAPIRSFSVNNLTNAQVYISFDGANDKLRLAPNSYKIWDVSANADNDREGYFLKAGEFFYIKQVSGAPTTGDVWIEVLT